MGDTLARVLTPEEILAAEARIRPRIRTTPVIEVDASTFGTAGPLSLKLEFMQNSGSFKARGAFNRALSQPIPPAGLVAASGGNHGAAVAFVGRALGCPAAIFVPKISPESKVRRLRDYGADVNIVGDHYVEALAASQERARATGALPIHAYDMPETLAGQGTVAVEWERQAPELDTVLVATGGGGLIGGMAAWYRGRIRVVSVEPELAPTLAEALKQGRPVDVQPSGIAADSLGAKRVGELMFPIAQQFVARAVLVTDDAIRHAQRMLWDRLRAAVEPGGATALAALVSGAYVPSKGERVGVLVCGANVNPADLSLSEAK